MDSNSAFVKEDSESPSYEETWKVQFFIFNFTYFSLQRVYIFLDSAYNKSVKFAQGKNNCVNTKMIIILNWTLRVQELNMLLRLSPKQHVLF